MRRTRKGGTLAFLRLSKMIWVVCCMGIAVVSYAIYSIAAWSEYQNSTVQSISGAKTDLSVILSDFTELKSKKIAELSKKVQVDAQKTERMCLVNRAVAYQSFLFAAAKQEIARCNETRSQMQQAVGSLQRLLRYAGAWVDIQQRIESLTVNEVKSVDIDKQAAQWGTLYKSIASGGDNPQEKQMKDNYKDTTLAVQKAWQAVAEKHAVKDYDGYNKATIALGNAYAKLAETEDKAKTSYQSLVVKAKADFQTIY